VEGDPSIHLTLRGVQPLYEHADLDRNPGIVATATHCVNSIPAVCEAPPGIRTYLACHWSAAIASPPSGVDLRPHWLEIISGMAKLDDTSLFC